MMSPFSRILTNVEQRLRSLGKTLNSYKVPKDAHLVRVKGNFERLYSKLSGTKKIESIAAEAIEVSC